MKHQWPHFSCRPTPLKSFGMLRTSFLLHLIIRGAQILIWSQQCVLADKEVMLVVEPGTHGSTYGGNPLGCAVSLRALELIEEEDMTGKAEKLGQIFREGVASFNSSIVQKVRGKGLLNAVVIDESAANGRSAWDLCILLKEKGLLVSLISEFCRLLVFTLRPPSLHRFTASPAHTAAILALPSHEAPRAELDSETSGC